MVTFTDRVPTYPGRVRLTPVAGQTNVYDLTREDDPVVAGTPLNAALFNALQDGMVEYGDYTGTGTTASISFSFAPKAFFIMCVASSYHAMAMWVKGSASLTAKAYNAENASTAVTWSDNTVSWSGSNASSMNASGKTYYYVALR